LPAGSNRQRQQAQSAPVSLSTIKRGRPNVLLLMADQFRFDCLGAAGNSQIHTPNLDRIAREGVRFTSAYSTTPTCTPARTALLTGMGPWKHGLLGYSHMASRPYPVEKARAMAEAGYFTLTVGKNHTIRSATRTAITRWCLTSTAPTVRQGGRAEHRQRPEASWRSAATTSPGSGRRCPIRTRTRNRPGWNDRRGKPFV